MAARSWVERQRNPTNRYIIPWKRHVEYIYYNPVKHGLARSPGEWRYSSFGRFVKLGLYAEDWGGLVGALMDERME